MKIYFVRHGHPDYEKDCLTELGQRQAAAAAERLRDSGIERIFASTHGRAMQTAAYTAELLGLDVVPCDFMREIGWGSTTDEPLPANGHPWTMSNGHVRNGETLTDRDWRESKDYATNQAVKRIKTVTDGVDAWLASLGYVREGEYYRVTGEEPCKAVAMFSHGGASIATLSHLFNLPFPQLVAILCMHFTSVTVVNLAGEAGTLTCPQLYLYDSMYLTNEKETAPTYGT
ncbi:MAG: histidine phosphatase family protein [Clostridia bacterium]|nr:histidine phosphatase family protein [Clostridia bacterium]